MECPVEWILPWRHIFCKEQGYEVIGVTMQIWQEDDVCTLEENGGCCGLSAVEDARRVAERLGIRYYVMNFRQEFQKNVIDYFVARISAWTDTKSVYRVQPLCEVGIAAAEKSGDWSGLYRDGTLCQNR